MVFVNAIESPSIQNFVFSLAVHRKSFPRAMLSPVKWMPIDFSNYNKECQLPGMANVSNNLSKQSLAFDDPN